MLDRFSVSVFLAVYLQVPISGNNVGSWAGITVLSCLEPWTATNTVDTARLAGCGDGTTNDDRIVAVRFWTCTATAESSIYLIYRVVRDLV